MIPDDIRFGAQPDLTCTQRIFGITAGRFKYLQRPDMRIIEACLLADEGIRATAAATGDIYKRLILAKFLFRLAEKLTGTSHHLAVKARHSQAIDVSILSFSYRYPPRQCHRRRREGSCPKACS